MKLIVAYTAEIDDVDLAVSEIMEQLDLEHSLLTHSAGLLTCYPEFVETGVVAAICERLPFAVVGCTSPGNGAKGVSGDMLLCLSVLTGDDISFSSVSIPVPDEADMIANVKSYYETAKAKLPEEPKLVIPFIPQTQLFYNELIFNELNRVSDNKPVFGTFVIDKTAGDLACYPIYEGKVTPDSVSLLLISGDIDPQFYWVSINQEKIRREKGIVTASDSYFIREVNHMPILKYLETIGLDSKESLEGVQAVPFMTDMGDDRRPIARTMWAVTEAGARVKGAIPEGASIAIGEMEFSGILDMTEAVLNEVLARDDVHGLLMFPCIAREYAMGIEPLAELTLIDETIGTKLPFHACYSGGELCPVLSKDGILTNQLHNFTFVMCMV